MFDLKTPTPICRPFRLGSIWERVAKDSGECYFGGYIESGVSGYVPLRIFRSKKNPNAWVIVRNLPGDRRHGAQEVRLPEADEPAGDYDHARTEERRGGKAWVRTGRFWRVASQ